VFTPIVLPLPHSRAAQIANRVILREALRVVRRRLGMDEFQLWSFLPTAAPYVGTLGESLAVYYCTAAAQRAGENDASESVLVVLEEANSNVDSVGGQALAEAVQRMRKSVVPSLSMSMRTVWRARLVTFGWVTISLLFGGTGAWASFAPLTSAAVARDTVVVDSNHMSVQQLDGGIIREILVRRVGVAEAGQVLRFEGAGVRSTLASLQPMLSINEAQKTRFHAHRAPRFRDPGWIAAGDAAIEARRSTMLFVLPHAGGTTEEAPTIDWNANQMSLPDCGVSGAITIPTPSELGKMSGAPTAPVICFNPSSPDVFHDVDLVIAHKGTYRLSGAQFKSLIVQGASDVIVDGIHVNGRGDAGYSRVEASSSRITINNSLFENVANMILYVRGAQDVTVQNSIFRDTIPEPHHDRHCIFVGTGSHRLKILNNIIYDCAGDGLQIAPGGTGPRDTVIADNHLYLSPKLIQPDGRACAENGFDFKGGSRVLVKNNVLYGFRPTDRTCGGSGSQGSAMIFHVEANNYVVDGNRAYNVPSCYDIKKTATQGGREIDVHYNLQIMSNNICEALPSALSK
jgi:Right handed beta helix region